jgi:hypothetical protein
MKLMLTDVQSNISGYCSSNKGAFPTIVFGVLHPYTSCSHNCTEGNISKKKQQKSGQVEKEEHTGAGRMMKN